MKTLKQVYQANTNQKKTEIIIEISDKVEFMWEIFKGIRGAFNIDKRNNIPRQTALRNLCAPSKLFVCGEKSTNL